MSTYEVKIDMSAEYPDGAPYMDVFQTRTEAESLIEAIKAAEAQAATAWPNAKVVGAFEAKEVAS